MPKVHEDEDDEGQGTAPAEAPAPAQATVAFCEHCQKQYRLILDYADDGFCSPLCFYEHERYEEDERNSIACPQGCGCGS